ncbi:MAG: MerR family transcriptional regulator [Pseudomonadota bacterium]
MEKSPNAFRTISEVSEDIDVPAHVLRFWESRFTQVKPVKRGGGRRYYRPEDVDLLRVIRELLYTEGLTIRGVQKLMRETGQKQLIEKYGASPLTIDDFGGKDAEASEPDLGDAALFDDTAGVELDAEPTAPSAAPPPAAAAEDAGRRVALKSVLTRLEGLRAQMSAPATSPGARD